MIYKIAVALIVLIIILIGCAIYSARSQKPISKSVSIFLFSIIIPVAGNLIIICSREEKLAYIGYYIYFIGMDILIFALLRFILIYSNVKKYTKMVKYVSLSLFTIDCVQYVVDMFIHHAFETQRTEVEGLVYYQLVAHLGQTIHRVIDYGVLAVVFGILVFKIVKSQRIYAERYYVILLSLLVTAIWETYYIFSRTPVDRSMIGFGVCGILVFYFSMFYRPMRLLDRMLASVASELPESMLFFDVNGTCIWANAPAKSLLGVGDRSLDAVIPKLDMMFGEKNWEANDWCAKSVVGENEDKRYFYLEKHDVQNELGKMMGAFLSIRDNTEEQKVLEQEKYNATHDSLTDLYTKERLFEAFEELLDSNPNTEYYVIYTNVNDFKIVNDIFGNLFGDYVLKYIAENIKNTLGKNGIAGRFVGDTFGMCIPVEDLDIEKVNKDLTHFTVTDGEIEHFLLMHIGIYKVVDRTLDVSSMFDRARIALSTIKEDYHTYVAYYDDEMRESVLWEQKITTELTKAIAERQIAPFLQPIVDAHGNVVGAEALVRWNHPEEGFLTPYRFIPIFEKNGMIADVDRHMWRCACEILAKWKSEGRNQFISINISPKDFYFMDVGEEIRSIVREYGVDPKYLRIEITESVMMSEQDSRFDILNEFRRDGFIVEMDDFGSGYSSLNMLKDMPVDLIKIDMAFLRKSDNSEKAEIILKNIVRLIYELGLISLTEGIETEEQYQVLATLGCSLFQGYYFAKPMPVDEFEEKMTGKLVG